MDSEKLLPVVIPRELFDFLMGVGEINGTSFGDLNAGLPGRFWWRALLRTAANAPTPENGLREALEELIADVDRRKVYAESRWKEEGAPNIDKGEGSQYLGAMHAFGRLSKDLTKLLSALQHNTGEAES